MIERAKRRRIIRCDLLGWQAIADALGKSRSTVIRWANRRADPLPVRRMVGQVTASLAELEEWVERNHVRVRDAG